MVLISEQNPVTNRRAALFFVREAGNRLFNAAGFLGRDDLRNLAEEAHRIAGEIEKAGSDGEGEARSAPAPGCSTPPSGGLFGEAPKGRKRERM